MLEGEHRCLEICARRAQANVVSSAGPPARRGDGTVRREAPAASHPGIARPRSFPGTSAAVRRAGRPSPVPRLPTRPLILAQVAPRTRVSPREVPFWSATVPCKRHQRLDDRGAGRQADGPVASHTGIARPRSFPGTSAAVAGLALVLRGRYRGYQRVPFYWHPSRSPNASLFGRFLSGAQPSHPSRSGLSTVNLLRSPAAHEDALPRHWDCESSPTPAVRATLGLEELRQTCTVLSVCDPSAVRQTASNETG